MFKLDITADQLVSALLRLASNETVCILDSCGVRHLGSHLLIAGIEPVETIEITNDDPAQTLRVLDEKLTSDLAATFTISYDFGRKLIGHGKPPFSISNEPDVFIAQFDTLIFHDYDSGITHISGNEVKFDAIRLKLELAISNITSEISIKPPTVTSNFNKSEYFAAIENIKELIRNGDTYQTNLTQQLTATLGVDLTPEIVFERLRRDHPAPFSAFIKRLDSTVISASPERFFKTSCDVSQSQFISTSPIKGTRPRGKTTLEDAALKQDLLTSEKDLAENTMIVDLLRNDLGRVCEYGSVYVEKLCEIEEHPTLFHLVSTVSGVLLEKTKPSDILNALFPCGSITGAPKINTMRIIDEIETAPRGLSMGAIGVYIPGSKFKVQSSDEDRDSEIHHSPLTNQHSFMDLSVAIRTMVIRDKTATFNVGGGIIIDSDPESEYEETLTKAKALLDAIGGKL